MYEKKPRIRCELTAFGNGLFERALMSAVRLRPNGRKNLLGSDPRYRPSKKSGNNAQNDSYHRFFLFISLKCLHRESARNRQFSDLIAQLGACAVRPHPLNDENRLVFPGPALARL